MTRLDRVLEAAEHFLNHPAVINTLMIICSVVLGLVFAMWLAGFGR
ncbi:hypothetical protein [Microlunatus parietis]|uniref:Uncharacterized protein n=1 Tax=Microlunatus parietis TaxID=682979 RepID=A0A7Y9I273_9ACTN|nr:hypothetical protein [Microlunatus parietis]NYE68887.1 hypothetical protein [Microlunatus parietis]